MMRKSDVKTNLMLQARGLCFTRRCQNPGAISVRSHKFNPKLQRLLCNFSCRLESHDVSILYVNFTLVNARPHYSQLANFRQPHIRMVSLHQLSVPSAVHTVETLQLSLIQGTILTKPT
jgi:hypothetical protein